MKILKFILKAIALIALLLTLFIFVSGKMYLFETLVYNFVGIDDLELFETRIVKTTNPIEWPTAVNYNKKPMPEKLEATLKQYQSIAFLVLKNDSVLNEYYWDGYNDSSLTNSFSMAKSFISVLTGIALKEGKIKSLDQKVGDFIAEFKEGNRNKLTIRHLLTMSAALSWEESYINPLGPTTEAYYGDDLKGMMHKLEVVGEPGKSFNYQSASFVQFRKTISCNHIDISLSFSSTFLNSMKACRADFHFCSNSQIILTTVLIQNAI